MLECCKHLCHYLMGLVWLPTFSLFFSILCIFKRAKTRLEMQKALAEDSTVYDYDGVYDDIQSKRLESSKKILGGADRKVAVRSPLHGRQCSSYHTLYTDVNVTHLKPSGKSSFESLGKGLVFKKNIWQVIG